MKDCGSCCCDNQKSSDTMMEDSLAAASQNSPLTAKEDDDDSNPDLAMDFIQRVWLNYNQTFNNNHNMERSFSSLRCLTFSSTRNSDEDGDDDEEAPAQAPTTTSRATPTTQATTTTTATTTPCLTSQHLDYLRQEMAALSPHVRPNAVEITPNVVSFAAHSGAALRALLGTLTGEPMLILQGQVPVQPSGGGGGGGTTTTMGRPTTTLDEFDSLLTCLKLSSPLLQPSNRKKNSHCRQDGNSDDDDDDGSTTSLAACRSSMSCSSCCDPPVAPAGVTLALLQLNLAGAMAGRQVGELVAQYWSKPCGLYMNGCQFNASFAQALAITSAIRVPYVLIVNHPQHCENNDQDNNNEDDDDDEEEKETAAQEQHEQQDRDQNTGITRRSALDPLWQFWAQESPSTREGKHHSSRGPSMIQLCHMDVHAHTLTCLTKLVLKIPSLTNSVNSRMTTTTTAMMKCSALQILKLKNISFDTSIPNHQWQAFVHAILHRVPSVDLSGCRNLPLVQVLAQSTVCAATASSRMVTTKNPKKLSVSQSTSTIVLGCQELILANTNLFQDCNGTQDLDRLHNFFQALFLSRDGDHIKEQHLFHSLLELDLSNCGVNNTVALALFSALEQQQHRSSTSNHPKLQKLVLGTTTVGNGEQHDDSIRASTQSRLYNQMLDHKTKHWMDCLPQISCLQELHLPSSLFFSTSSTSPPSVLAAGRKRFLESLARNSSLTKVVLVSRKLEYEEDETYLMGTTNNNEDEDDLHFSHQIRAITNRNIGIRSVQEALLLAAQEDDNNNSIGTTGRPDHWIDVSWSVGGDKNNNNNNSTSPETTSNPNHTGASRSSSSSSSGDYYWSNRNLGLLTSCTVLEPILRNHNHSALYLLLQQGIFPLMVAATLRHSRPLIKAYNNDDPTTTGLNCHSSSKSTCKHY